MLTVWNRLRSHERDLGSCQCFGVIQIIALRVVLRAVLSNTWPRSECKASSYRGYFHGRLFNSPRSPLVGTALLLYYLQFVRKQVAASIRVWNLPFRSYIFTLRKQTTILIQINHVNRRVEAQKAVLEIFQLDNIEFWS